MLFLLVTLVSTAAPSLSHPSATTAPPHHCPLPALTYAAPAKSVGHGAHRLAEELLASEYLAVHRMVNGCPNPAIVRTGIGR